MSLWKVFSSLRGWVLNTNWRYYLFINFRILRARMLLMNCAQKWLPRVPSHSHFVHALPGLLMVRLCLLATRITISVFGKSPLPLDKHYTLWDKGKEKETHLLWNNFRIKDFNFGAVNLLSFFLFQYNFLIQQRKIKVFFPPSNLMHKSIYFYFSF